MTMIDEIPGILVVEDDPGTAELQRRSLQRAGFRAEVASDAVAALHCIESREIALVVLDYRLADGTGLDFYERLKTYGTPPPTILVTGFSNEALVVQALRAGVSDFVPKSPDYLDYLPHAVRQVLDKARTERLLVESEARKAAMLESALDAIVTINDAESVIEFNPAAEAAFGYRRDEAMGRNLAQLVHPQAIDGKRPEGFRYLLETDEGALIGRRIEMTAHRKDGAEIFVELSISTARQGNRPLYTLFFRDITERKRMETGLKLQQRALEEVSEGILFTDPTKPDNPIVYANAAFERLTGYALKNVLGRNCRFLQGRETDPVAVGKLRRAVEQRRACSVELRNYRADGTPFWNAVSIAPLHDDAGKVTHFVGVQIDVTQHRELEAQVRQAHKMEAIGRLAGGIAHDFNNLLTIIMGNAEFAQNEIPAGNADLEERIGEIAEAAERAASLTKQLLAFSRRQVLEPKPLDLNELIKHIDKMLQRLLGADVALSIKLDPGIDSIRADPTQIEQILLNLAVNARDAMPLGGSLLIETSSAELDAAYADAHPEVHAGQYVKLSVTDTGVGITPDVMAHIFEPFFTTKEPGEGTGMGLATVFGIVKQSEGHITAYSEPGLGTTFTVYFPAHRLAAARTGCETPTTARGTETILLVEDEDPVRRLARQILSAAGYEVIEAASGNDALRRAQEHPGPIHMTVTDVVMPGMNGREMAERLTVMRPGIKVLYVSGYPNDAVVGRGMLPPGTVFMQKPFTQQGLTAKVRQVLDSAATPHAEQG